MNIAIQDLLTVVEAMETHLSNWQERVDQLDSLLGDFSQLFLLGRGASIA